MDSVQLAGVALAALLSENFVLVSCMGIGYTLSQALTFALCGGLGVLVVLMSYAGLREEISLTSCPRPFRGPAIEMVTAGLMALALVGFYGLHLS